MKRCSNNEDSDFIYCCLFELLSIIYDYTSCTICSIFNRSMTHEENKMNISPQIISKLKKNYQGNFHSGSKMNTICFQRIVRTVAWSNWRTMMLSCWNIIKNVPVVWLLVPMHLWFWINKLIDTENIWFWWAWTRKI
jgi:hypothetical protein